MLYPSGIVLGRLAGIEVRLHWSFLLAAGWFFQDGFDLIGLLLYGILFASVLFHELGHCFAARSVGGRADSIVLWPLGGVAYTEANRGNVLNSVWISLAGPLVNLLLALACAAGLWGQGYGLQISDFWPLDFEPSGQLTSSVGVGLFLVLKMQMMLFCFNLMLPAYPLDGGQALASLLSSVVPLQTCSRIMAGLTTLTAVGLWSQQEVFLAVFLGIQVPALLGPASDFHPLSHFYNRPGVIEGKAPVYGAPGLKLRPCLQCQEKLHPESEVCSNCGQKYPFA
ncbi:MAG: M50 family metallopeptidase [Candidatus Eremiobacteraeota bacterium]|nr:M50 family metallopeptidase [Candidatus Eremiobacteraeota bacterium]MCW5868169.1 M50 family metallopeptidase [Candidatus Eremiobacteraeota bacterium]